jgi:glycine/D-amino acid oxidase-like deaminating enzyme
MLCDDKPWILNNMATKPSYLIVGAGVFGVSTAYHLIKKYPDRQVTILDQDAYDSDNRVAASWDWNKVVRADYDDRVYCKLALEAQDIFESDPLWKPFFHKTGIFWVCRSDYAQDVMDNYKALGRAADLQAVSIEEAKKLFGGLFEDANYDGAKEVLVNKTSGWAEAGASLRAVTKWSMEKGVKYVTGKAETLAFHESGRCTGVKTEQGNTVSASHVILSTGAYTAKLLEQAAKSSGNNNLRSGSRIVAGGITTGMTTLDESSYKRFADMPVGVQGYTAATASSNGGARRSSRTHTKSCQGVSCPHHHQARTTTSGTSRAR